MLSSEKGFLGALLRQPLQCSVAVPFRTASSALRELPCTALKQAIPSGVKNA